MTRLLHSVQGRIVIGSVLIAAVVVAILGLVVNDVLRQVAGSAVVTVAREELVPFVTDLRDRPSEDPDAPGTGEMILVVSPQGTTVVDTVPAGLASTLVRGGTDVNRVHAGGVSYIAVGTTVVNARGTWHVWALRDAVSADLALQQLGRTLLQFVPLVLVLVAIGSWLLVGAALRPVRRLRTAAERIQRAGVASRLPEGRGRDELAALAATLNGFLDEQRAGVERERRRVTEASHELRTPIAVLMTRLELAAEHHGDADALEAAVLAAHAQARALSRLATQLLEIAQLDAEDGERAPSTSSVGDAISEVMAAVDRMRVVAADGVQIELELASDLHETRRIPLSAVAFRRVVDNLAINAVHATSSGSVDLAIGGAPGLLVLTVADTGTGVPPGFLPRAFDRFARSEQSRASGVAGSGLGLALVQGLVQAAGGRIRLENRSGGGAVATVEIPLLDDGA